MNDVIRVSPNGVALVDYGPMRMSISVFDRGKPLVDLAKEGARLATEVLQDLVRSLSLIKRKAYEIEMEETFPDAVRRMIEATKKMEEPDLTPLAAVAGAASDVVADFIIRQGGTKVIVDNGGDIAIRLRGDEVVKVGVKTDIHAMKAAYLIPVDLPMGVGGVATSGLGGRSFTKGIASAVTVLSENASLADAAATIIANFTDVKDPNIKRSLAERIYPDTDIAGEWVTTEIGRLSRKKVEEALENGLAKAYSISKRGLIKGALIAVKGRAVVTDSLKPYVRKLE